MIEQSARRRDQDVDAASELRGLRPEADTAEDGRRCDLEMLAVRLDRRFDLRAELARGRDDKHAQRLARPVRVRRRRGGQALEDGQDESGGLAGPGLRAGQQIAAGEHGGNRLRLNGGRDGVSLVGHRAQQRAGQP